MSRWLLSEKARGFDPEAARNAVMSALNNAKYSQPEVWMPVVGYEGKYSVSTEGRVYSMSVGKIITNWITESGYSTCNLYINGKNKTMRVHRLIYAAHVAPIPKGWDVAHLNGKRSDCRLANLACVTKKENQFHKVLHGTDQSGERSGTRKLNWAKVDEIRTRSAGGESAKALSVEFEVNLTVIYDVVRLKRWLPSRNPSLAAAQGRIAELENRP